MRDIEYVLTVRSQYQEGEVQYLAFLPIPSRNKRIMEMAMLIKKLGDSIKFKRNGDRLCHVDRGEGMTCTPIHPLIGKLLELEYQAELQQIMHQDWDEFKLIWDEPGYVNFTSPEGEYVWIDLNGDGN